MFLVHLFRDGYPGRDPAVAALIQDRRRPICLAVARRSPPASPLPFVVCLFVTKIFSREVALNIAVPVLAVDAAAPDDLHSPSRASTSVLALFFQKKA